MNNSGYLLIFAFIVYFLINVLQFMRTKNHNDGLLLQKNGWTITKVR